MSDEKRWTTRQTLCFAFFASAGLWGLIVWAFTQWWPYMPSGEGPKQENFPYP